MINGGLFSRANEGRREYLRGNYNDRLSMVALDEYTINARDGKKLTKETMITRLDSEKTREQEPWIDKVRYFQNDIETTDIIEVTSKEEGYIYHVIVNENGSVEVINVGVGEDSQVMPELREGDIGFIYLPSTDTNGNVIVEITTKIEGYRIQYRTDEIGWTDYQEGIEYEKNGIIYARLASETSNTYVTKVANRKYNKHR